MGTTRFDREWASYVLSSVGVPAVSSFHVLGVTLAAAPRSRSGTGKVIILAEVAVSVSSKWELVLSHSLTFHAELHSARWPALAGGKTFLRQLQLFLGQQALAVGEDIRADMTVDGAAAFSIWLGGGL